VQHLETLARFSEKEGHKYYTLIHQGVRFSHYVGAIQVGKLCIEILPKADKTNKADLNVWHDVLIDMLRCCRLLKIETISSARLQLRSNAILELYFELFLNEVELLVRKGLIKSYRKTIQNNKVVKGKIIITKQLRENHAKQHQVIALCDTYDLDNLPNQIIKQALSILNLMLNNKVLSTKLARLNVAFHKVKTKNIRVHHFTQVTENRRFSDYQKVLEISKLLILNYHPDIKGGRHQVLAILFDMNLLFEEYVYRILKRLENKDLTVRRQAQCSFWKRTTLKPDILIRYKGENHIVDTKWKALKKPKPAIADLRQMYVYCQYFDAQKSILIYPHIYPIEPQAAQAYHPTNSQSKTITCQLCFPNLIRNGQLNPKFGKEILESL